MVLINTPEQHAALWNTIEKAKEHGMPYVGINAFGDITGLEEHQVSEQYAHIIDLEKGQTYIERKVGEITLGDLLVPEPESTSGL